MTRSLRVALAFVLLASVAACGSRDDSDEAKDYDDVKSDVEDLVDDLTETPTTEAPPKIEITGAAKGDELVSKIPPALGCTLYGTSDEESGLCQFPLDPNDPTQQFVVQWIVSGPGLLGTEQDPKTCPGPFLWEGAYVTNDVNATSRTGGKPEGGWWYIAAGDMNLSLTDKALTDKLLQAVGGGRIYFCDGDPNTTGS